MSLDSPDYSNAVIAARALLGSFTAADESASIALPSTVTALWVWYAALPATEQFPTATGDQSTIVYPVYQYTASLNDTGYPPFVFLVEPALDSSVTVAVGSPPFGNWFVTGDTSLRIAAALPFIVPTLPV